MTTRLPQPPRPLPDLRRSDVITASTGATFGRIFFAAGAHPAAWNSFRNYGPVAHMRFDHQPAPAKAHRTRSICYLAPAGGFGSTFDPLETCVRETFHSTNTIDVHTGSPWFTIWASERDLVLLDVNDSPWIARAGGNAAISSGARGTARSWARAIYRQYPEVDGIYFQASTLPAARSVALFERARSALPASYLFNQPLVHPGLRGALRRIAHTYDMRLIF